MAQAIPNSAQPSRTSERVRTEDQRPVPGNDNIITLPTDNGKQAAPMNAQTTFILNEVLIENSNAFSVDQIRPDYEAYIGQKVSLSTLNEIAAKITAHYRNAGYILSRAVVAPQRIQNGVVVMRIVEGYVNQVIFEGNKGTSPLLNEYAQKIRDSKPLNAAVLERYLLLMEDLPGVNARATLRPSATVAGASDVIITIDDSPISAAATLDNRGTKYMGPLQGGLTVSANNMITSYDRTQVHGLMTSQTKELKYGELSHQMQLDDDGTKLDATISYTKSDAGSKLKDFDVIGHDFFYSAKVSHPFLRTRQSNVYGNIGFDVRDTQVKTLGTRLYEDKLKVVRGGLSYDFVDSTNATNRIEGGMSKGLPFKDSSDADGARSRATGSTGFIKTNFDASRMQPVYGPVSAYLATSAQFSPDSLLTSEQFGVGGANFGSAYDPSEILGDSGVAARLELQYSRQGDIPYIPSYQLYTFYDIGEVWTRYPSTGQNHDESLASTGVGVRFNVAGGVDGGLEFALPLTRQVASTTDRYAPRVFFNLGYKYY